MDDQAIGVLLHVHEAEAAGTTPVTTPLLCDRIVGDDRSMSRRIELCSTLSELESGAYLEQAPVLEHEDGERIGYRLTNEGRQTAVEHAETVAQRELTVVEADGEQSMTVDAASEQYFDGSLATAYTALEDGLLRVGSSFAPVVGREEELAAARTVLDELPDHNRAGVVVTGPGGIGKTTLLEQIGEAAADSGYDVLHGRCRQGADSPYHALIDALESHDEAEVPSQFVAEQADPADPEEHEAARVALFDALRSAVELSPEQPTVLLLDDVHWIDQGTAEWLFFALESRSKPPLCCCCAGRPEAMADDHQLASVLTSDRVDQYIELDGLDRADTRALIESFLEQHGVPESFVEQLHEHTGGSPLFVESILDHLRSIGAVDPTHGVYPTDVGSLKPPTAVHETVDRRIGWLDEDVQDVLEWAAVVGTSVPLPVLTAVADHDRQTCLEHCDALEGSRILERDGAETVRFVSAVVHEAVLERLDDSTRSNRHAAVANAFETALEEPPAEAIARQYDEAGDEATATRWYQRAGDDARERLAVKLAIDYYDRGLKLARSLAEPPVPVTTVLESLGDAYTTIGEFETAEKYFRYLQDRVDASTALQRAVRKQAKTHQHRSNFERAIELAEQGLDTEQGTPGERCELLHVKGSAHIERGELDQAQSYLERERALATEHGDDRRLGQAEHALGALHIYQGDLEEAHDRLQRSESVFAELGFDRGQCNALNNLGIVASLRGNHERAIENYESHLEIARELGNLHDLGYTLNNLGHVYMNQGEFDRAVELYQESLETTRAIGKRSGVATAHGSIGQIDMLRGDFDNARIRYQKRLELETELDSSRGIAVATRLLGRLDLLEGDTESAQDRFQRSLDQFAELGIPRHQIHCRCGLARVALERDVVDVASEHADQAVALAQEIDDSELLSVALLAQARTRRVAGALAEAQTLLEDAYDAMEAAGRRIEEPRIALERGYCHRAVGDDEAAKAAFEHARDLAAAMEMEPVVSRCESALSPFE